MYPTLVALNCLGRTCCINAATTARGMQQVGLLFVLSPALRWLYPEGAARARAFARYGGHSNTHPFMIPLFVGILLSLEEEIAKGTLPESAVSSVRETLATTLSALGDSFFSGTLLPLWALVSVALLLSGHIALAGFLAVAAFQGGQFFFRPAPRHAGAGAPEAPQPHQLGRQAQDGQCGAGGPGHLASAHEPPEALSVGRLPVGGAGGIGGILACGAAPPAAHTAVGHDAGCVDSHGR